MNLRQMKKLEQRSNCVFNGSYIANNLEFKKFKRAGKNPFASALVGFDYKGKCYYCKKTFSNGDLYVKTGGIKVCRICIEKQMAVALENLSLVKSHLKKKLAWLKKHKEKLNNEELINAL
jgi:hypothetical protein